MIHPETLGHRLHRLASPIREQTPQIQLALGPLILTRQRIRQHRPSKLQQQRAHLRDLIRRHATSQPASIVDATTDTSQTRKGNITT